MTLSREQVAQAYDRFGHLVLRRCRFILHGDAEAEDALQEVFVRLLKYGEAFPAAASPVRWLYRVADTVCFDQLARRRHAPQIVEDVERAAGTSELPEASRDPDAADRQLVRRLLECFDDTMKRLAVLHFVDQLTQGEIAVELGWSRQTVNKKLGILKVRAAALGPRLGVV